MELESPPLVRFQPALHLGTFVGAVIVHDEMHLLIGRQLRFQMIEKLDELSAAMAILASADDFAIQNIECGEQSGSAMASVIVRLTLWQAGSQRKEGSGAIHSLNLAFLVHTQYQGAFRADSNTGLRYPAPFPQNADRWTA